MCMRMCVYVYFIYVCMCTCMCMYVPGTRRWGRHLRLPTSMCICVIVSRTNHSRVNAPCHTGLCMTLAATAMAARVHSHGIPCELLDSFMSVAKMLLKESVPTTAGFVYVCVLQCVVVCCSSQDAAQRERSHYCRVCVCVCVAVCCSVLQCVAVCCNSHDAAQRERPHCCWLCVRERKKERGRERETLYVRSQDVG